MKTRTQGKIRYWALVISFAVHAAALGVFTGVKLRSHVVAQDSAESAVSMQMVQQIVSEPKPARPKPRVEPVVKRPQPKPVQVQQPKPLPVISESTPPEPVEAEVVEPVITEPVTPPVPMVNEVEFFGQKSITDRICYVVDCSGSMYGQMYQVREQLKKSILNLNSDQAFAIVFFKDGRKILTGSTARLEVATAAAKSNALQLIESVRPLGSTDAAYALNYAMRMKDKQGNGPRIVYFLTDGFDLDERSSVAFVNTFFNSRKKLAPNVILHTIGFWPQSQDCRMLTLLAEKTGGEFIKVGD